LINRIKTESQQLKNVTAMSKYNKTPNQQKTNRVIIRLTDSEKDHLRKIAFNQNKTISRVITEKVFDKKN
jgi:hypothetical protein